MPEIVITEFIDLEPVERLKAHYSVHLDEELWQKPDELMALARDAKALIVRNRTQVSEAVLKSGPGLKAIGRLGVGLDNIDVAACEKRAIAVLPAFGVNARSVAEYVLASALMLLRGSAYFGAERLAAGQWPRAEMGQGREAEARTMGLIGFGSIGRVTAGLARAAGLRTIAYDAQLEAGKTVEDTELVDFAALLARADIVSLHCPLTAQTRNLIAQKELAAMKPGAIVINTARGNIVNEQALADALRSGHLGGAAVDVFASEPITSDAGAIFKGLPNVILTPHIAGITVESNARTSAVTVDNVLRALGKE
ncbi:MAG TPA: hydroxyacid dehydrogenase [Hyphomicrobiaceae bacterium]|nr:hydroxyacid dehydrogenase [Hyphomicrobiaceae bacterium]